VTATPAGFVVTGARLTFIRPDGNPGLFHNAPARPVEPGDIGLGSREGPLRVLRPGNLTSYTPRVPGVRLRALSNGILWGNNTMTPGTPAPTATVVWSRDGRSWRQYTHDSGNLQDFGSCCYFFEVTAAGNHAAAWACGDVASGGVCGRRLAVTRNAGGSWTVLASAERPFPTINAGVAAGSTLMLTPGRSRHGRIVWRSTEDLDTLRAARAPTRRGPGAS
jgi:hypothetical protein